MFFRRHFMAALAIGALTLSGAARVAAQASTQPTSDTQASTVILRVNGTDITQAQSDELMGRFMQRQMQQMAMQGQQPDPQTMMQMHKAVAGHVREQLIKRTLLDAEIDKVKDQVAAEEVEAELTKLRAMVAKDGRNLDEMIAQNNTTLDQLKEDLRKRQSIFLVAKAHGAQIDPTAEEVDQKFAGQQTRVRASHILVPMEDPATTATAEAGKTEELKGKALAESLRDRAKKGEDFAALAQQFSTCPSAKKGGDLGEFSPGQMVPEFDKVAFALKPGEISDVVQTQFGYHVIKVVEHKDLAGADADAAKAEIREGLRAEKVDQALPDILDKLEKSSKVEVLVPLAEDKDSSGPAGMMMMPPNHP